MKSFAIFFVWPSPSPELKIAAQKVKFWGDITNTGFCIRLYFSEFKNAPYHIDLQVLTLI